MAAFPGDPADIIGLGLCTIRCERAFLKARRLAVVAGDELDGHARLPALRARQPRDRLRDHLVGLHHPPLHGALQRQRGQQHRGPVADRHRHVAVERRPGGLRALEHTPRDALRAADAGRRRRLRHRRGRRGDRHPRGTSRGHHRQRQGDRGPGLRPDRREDRAGLAGHLHRLHGARPREQQGAHRVLDELRLYAAQVPLREPRHTPRHVDDHLVSRPSGRRVRPGGRHAPASRASSTSNARRSSWRRAATAS